MNYCGNSISAMHPAIQPGEGGSIPTLPLDRHAWRVRPVSLDCARAMVVAHHYGKGGSNTAVATFGVMPADTIFEADAVAVAWFLPPTKICGASVWPDDPQAVVALSRLVATPAAPKNTASFLLRHAVRLLDRERWPIVVTFADEWQGHTGGIYRAAGWIECGVTRPAKVYVKDGRMVSRKSGPKTRCHSQMLAIGCECMGSFRRHRFVHVRPDLREQFEPIRQRLVAA